MKQVLIKKGSAFTKDVPVPALGSGEVLVQLHASCISMGTEFSSIKGSSVPLWKRAAAQPEKLITTAKIASNEGIRRAIDIIQEKAEAEYPTGYSASGIVVDVGSEVTEFVVGDRVACAGGGYAFHAEFIRTPVNLCVPLPASLSFNSASTVTLGAIALQGVRRSNPTLGETFVVIGLGVLGQITAQILRANGCRVIGIDIDRSRLDIALSLGMEFGYQPFEGHDTDIYRLTDGYGVDGVIITAASSSSSILSSAFKYTRKKGRVVLVGDVGLDLNRSDIYEKELDFFISSSYGPGRYDQRYEEQGLDYPIGYVRWTENRNMSEYINLLSENKVVIGPLINSIFTIHEASLAYSELTSIKKPLLILLTYPPQESTSNVASSLIPSQFITPKLDGTLRVAVIGSGSFARSTHLPNIKLLKHKLCLQAVVNRSGPVAVSLCHQYQGQYATSDPSDVFRDPEIDAVIIATRHDLHAELALKALHAGKHVLVEKPLTLLPSDLDKFENFYSKSSSDCTPARSHPLLLTGFNRRFSPFAKRLKQLVERRTNPFIFNYVMNAGYIAPDHWVHNSEGGGRNLGEACHIYDLFSFLTGQSVVSYSAHSIKPLTKFYRRNDNFSATVSYADGSVCNLIYTSLGNDQIPKETGHLFVDGNIAILDDYKTLNVYGRESLSLSLRSQDKGLFDELESFADAITSHTWPIPLAQQLEVTKLSFGIEQLLYS